METLTMVDWLIVLCASLALLLLFLLLFYVFLLMKNRQKLTRFEKTRFKNKKHKKTIKKKIRQLKERQRNIGKKTVLLILLIIFASGAAWSVQSYQSTRLSTQDQQDIADSDYYLKKLDSQLETIEKEEDTQKALENIDTLSSRIAIYAIKKADSRLNEEGQLVINKYYRSLKELGINIASQPKDFYTEPVLLNSVKEDIKKVKKNEQAVLRYFDIDSKTLSKSQ